MMRQISGITWHTLSAGQVLQSQRVERQAGLSSAEVAVRAQRLDPTSSPKAEPSHDGTRSRVSTVTGTDGAEEQAVKTPLARQMDRLEGQILVIATTLAYETERLTKAGEGLLDLRPDHPGGRAEVIQEAGVMILTDDNFSTIINVGKLGRGLPDNLSLYILYQAGGMFGYIATFLGVSIFNIAKGIRCFRSFSERRCVTPGMPLPGAGFGEV